jgi:hypothetical protein
MKTKFLEWSLPNTINMQNDLEYIKKQLIVT